MEYADGRLIARKDGPIGWLIFNQPERRNAITLAMWQAIPAALDAFVADPGVRVVVARGAGEQAFTAGADISEFEKVRETMTQIEFYEAANARADQAFAECVKPLIAMIHGFCMGGGMGLAIKADLRLASTESRFGIPAAKLGLGYEYPGVKTLVDLIGPSFTKEIFFTGRQFTAEEAVAMGLVNRTARPAELEELVRSYARTIAENAPLTVKAVKQTVAAAVADPEKRDLATVARLVNECFASEDYVEGRKAFMEKRKPVFRGR